MKGGVPKEVFQWASAHQGELALNWARAETGHPVINTCPMSETASFRKIAVLEPLSGHRLAVAWDGAPKMVVDLTDVVKDRPAFKALLDERLFRRARIADYRRAVERPEPSLNGEPALDIDADTLHEIAVYQDSRGFIARLLEHVRPKPRRA